MHPAMRRRTDSGGETHENDRRTPDMQQQYEREYRAWREGQYGPPHPPGMYENPVLLYYNCLNDSMFLKNLKQEYFML